MLNKLIHIATYTILQELQAKNEAANAKLRQMVKDQQEAEKKKVESQEIQVKNHSFVLLIAKII